MNWKEIINFHNTDRYQQIKIFIENQKKSGAIILPEEENIFRAFNLTPFEEVKVVILGQDPYHSINPTFANGLAFSVFDSIKPLPRSLINIYKEMKDDIGGCPPNGDLSFLAKQGVLLLNTCLTVQAHKANSHSNIGWEYLSDEVISKLSNHKNNIVFILWGGNARSKTRLIDSTKHLIIESAHPSPLSASKGFFGSKPFSRTNDYLDQPIKWF
jgi:uracil-DNA glycosylase